MHDQATSPSPSNLALSDDLIDATVLDLLLASPATPWSLWEIGLELGDQLQASDAVARLACAGVVHRFDGFVFVTRATRRVAELRAATS